MITAINYAAQAERGLRAWTSSRVDYEYREEDIYSSEMLARLIRKSEHFAVPDNGRIFDDNLKGLRDLKARLPYKHITIEYYVEPKERYCEETPIYSHKRLVIASEITENDMQEVEEFFPSKESGASGLFSRFPDDIIIQILVVIAVDGVWTPAPMSWLMPIAWNHETEGMREFESLTKAPEGSTRVSGIPVPVLPGMLKKMIDTYGYEKANKYAMNDIAEEIGVVLELLEALACSNVGIDTIQAAKEAVNKKRAKKGKLPIYETKVLSLDVPSAGKRGTGVMVEGKRSPRQHLRRGHIRRLSQNRRSEKRIWVNSCAVGSKNNGCIKKQYSVSPIF